MDTTKLSTLCAAVALMAWAGMCAYAWGFTVDDAYITFRYAGNLAAGLGPNFNPGERAEGYTSFLWMLLMALPHLLDTRADVVAKLVGIMATLGTFGLVALLAERLARREAPDRCRFVPATVAIAALALDPDTAVHAVSGMETALFGCLVIALMSALVVTVEAPGRIRTAVAAVLALLVGLTRPEGNLVAGAGLGVALLLLRGADRRALLLAALGLYIVPGVAYFIWRYGYYGYLFPLSFYVKVSGSREPLPGLAEVAGFLKVAAFHLGPFAAFGLWHYWRPLLPALAAAGALLLFFLFPEHMMGYHSRFLSPVCPLLAVLAGLGFPHFALALQRRLRVRVLALAGALGGLLIASQLARAPSLADVRRYAVQLERAHGLLARRLAPLAAGRDADQRPTLAIADAGLVPYVSGWNVVDTIGLNEPAIAAERVPASARILSRPVELVVLNSRDGESFAARVAGDQSIHDAVAGAGMKRVASFEFGPGYHLLVLGRPGAASSRAAAGLP